ncbi:hypothetical protein [Chelativorans salis]|uniref:Uncharacterized protein n=1 Tax=Chelativorans salis TaxID=2978478 RepID=A0ABT2LVP8_9HYPH|nr:hypothetical protein [Chelativorans sp. EGI FJ00035]MCT7378179.1 hypothetical protein [Chelativorans sp. EGI FJ00035]
MAKRKFEEGSKITIKVEAESVWPDGRFTFYLGGHSAPITIPGDSPQIMKVEAPKRTKVARDVRD